MSKGWLSRKDFELLDDLFSKLGYGGYYDFLECLKSIGSEIGAFTVEGGEIDREELKTIRDVMALLDNWAEAIQQYRLKNNFEIDNILLKLAKREKLRKGSV